MASIKRRLPKSRSSTRALNQSFTLRDRLEALARFLPIISKPGFEFCKCEGRNKRHDGVIEIPFYSLSSDGSAFVESCYKFHWVASDIDWTKWQSSAAAHRLYSSEVALSEATATELQKLLTLLVRKDRFCEGALAEDFDRGVLTRIVQRASVLLNEAKQRDAERKSERVSAGASKGRKSPIQRTRRHGSN